MYFYFIPVKCIPGLYRVIQVCQDLIEEYSMVTTQGEGESHVHGLRQGHMAD